MELEKGHAPRFSGEGELRRDRRLSGEICKRCGGAYDVMWRAPDDLWRLVTGAQDGSGTWCPTCFHEVAWSMGITLFWECSDGRFPSGRPAAW